MRALHIAAVRGLTAVGTLLLLTPHDASAQLRIARPSSGATLSAVATGPAPLNVRAGATPTSITLRWGCPEGASGYEVYAAPVGGGQVKLTPTPIAPQCVVDYTSTTLQNDPRLTIATGTTTQQVYVSSFTHSGLAPGMQFSYVVRALYPQAIGDAAPITAQTAPWPAPTGLTTTLSGRSAQLSWSPVAGATGYLVFRKLAGEAAMTQLTAAPIGTSSYSDATPLPPGTHAYTVQAANGVQAAAVTVVLGNWPAPGITQSVLTGRRITLNWTPISGASGYIVSRKSGAETAFRQIATTPVTQQYYVEENLPIGPHTFIVQAAGGGDPSVPSTVISGKPVGGVHIYRGQPVIDLGWQGLDLATMIKIFRSPALNAAYYDITSQTDGVRAGDATTFGFSRYRHATVGATEYYKIAAFYPSGVMESDPIAATIPLGPVGPTNIRAESPAKTDRYISSGQGSVWITWTCDPEATSYSAMKGKTGSGVEWIMDSRGFPLKIYGCAMLDIFWPGAIPIWDYKIVGNYNDPDTSSEGWVTVPIIKQP